MVTLLNDADCARVRDAIAAAEKTTAGEIRVLCVERSVMPDPVLGALATLAVGVAAWLWLSFEAWGHPTVLDWLGAAGIGIAVGAAVALTAPRFWSARAVQRRAIREFGLLGIAKTAGRTGVLIMLSEREHQAVLLADRAINDKVPTGTWDGILQALIGEIRQGRAADAMVHTIDAVGRHLAQHFPRKPDDVNELPDDVHRKA
jgi:putative membrane protein